MRTIRRCKLHGEPYTVCPICAHQYCERYWPRCPRCAELRRMVAAIPAEDNEDGGGK
jgi:hypothetical protein